MGNFSRTNFFSGRTSWRPAAAAMLLGLLCCLWSPGSFAADNAPSAHAGNDLVAPWGRRVRLEGDASRTAPGDDVEYRWTIIQAPPGSRRDLDGADTPNPILALDQPGTFEVQLIVSDGRSTSRPDTVVVRSRLPAADATQNVARIGTGSDVDGDGVPDAIDNCVDDFNPTQYDSNGDGFGNRCDPDLDNDGFITNFGDLGLLRLAFFTSPSSPNWNPDADFNEDNLVNVIDLGIMKTFFFGPPGPLALTFINPAGGSWHDPANWLPPVVPNTTHTVRIDLDPGVVVEYSTGSSEVAGVLATSPILISGGDLSVAGTMQVDAPLTLQGGELSNATLLAPTTLDEVIVPAGQSFTLDDVTLGADLTIENGARLDVPGGLTLSGATVTLASTGASTLLDFVSGERTLGGIGEIVFGGASANNTIWTNSSQLLTIGPDVTIRSGTSGGTLGWSAQRLSIEGTLVSDLPGNTVNLYGTDVSLHGPMLATGGGSFNLQLGGNSIIDTPLLVSGGGGLTIGGGAWVNAAGNTISVGGGGNLSIGGNGWTNAAGATISIDGGELSLSGDWTNDGQITATDALLDIGASFADEWSNNGVIDAVNSPVQLGGSFAIDDIGTINTTGDVLLDGLIENTGLTLDLLAALPGTVTLGNGGVVGGTLTGSPIATGVNTPFNLTGVTLATDLTISNGTRLNVNGDLTLDSATVTLESTGTFTLMNFVTGLQSLGGTGEVVFGGTSSNNTIWSNTGQLLTIGPDITIRTGTSAGTLGWSAQQMAIEGTLVSDVSGTTFNVYGLGMTLQQALTATGGGSFNLQLNGTSTIDATVSAVGGGSITIGGAAWTNAAGNTISIAGGNLVLSGNGWSNAAGATISVDGGELSVFGSWTNNGQITATNGLLDVGNTFGDEWTNTGAIDAVNSPVELGGRFTISDVGTFNTVGSVLFDGLIDNTSQTLDLATALPGVVTLGNGGILGGTLTGSPVTIDGVTFTLDGVTLATNFTLGNGSRLNVPSGLTLDNTTVTLASTGTSTLMDFVSGEQVLGGTGEVVFGGSASNNTIYTNNAALLTIGPDIVLRTGSAGGTLGWSAQQLAIQGKIEATTSGQNILVDGMPTTITGAIEIGATSTVTMSADYTLGASAALDIELESDTVFGRLLAPGQSVTLGGTLTVNVAGGFTTAACDSFEILTWGSQGGAFNSENYPDLGGGTTFDVAYFATGMVLTTPGTCTGNLSLLPGVVATSSSDYSGSYVAALAIDGVNATNSSWCTANYDPAPELELAFPSAITVTDIVVTNTWTPAFDFLTGRFEIFDASDTLIYDSGVVSFTAGGIALDVSPDTSGARRVVFSGVSWNSIEPCLSEFEVIGTQP